MINLKTTESRLEALKKINGDCHQAFINAGIELSPDAIFGLSSSTLDISIRCLNKESRSYRSSVFASDITIYAKRNNYYNQENEINFGCTGSFNPENKASYWRTIHAASCLKNWDKVCEIVNTYCDRYKQLEDEMLKQSSDKEL